MGSRDFCHAGYWAEGVLSSVRWETGLSLAGSRAWPVLLLCLVRCSAGGWMGWLSHSADRWSFSRLRGCPPCSLVLSLSDWAAGGPVLVAVGRGSCGRWLGAE